MNIAVILNADTLSGGGFQYALSNLLILNKYKNEKYNFIFFTTVKQNIKILEHYNVSSHYLHFTKLDRFLQEVVRARLIYKFRQRLKIYRCTKLDKKLNKYNIDLIYFVTPSSLALATSQYNYIFTAWDLCHRDHVEFPEVRELGEFESREYLLKNVLAKATKIITESDLNKENVVRRYSIDEERVVAIPMIPSVQADITNEDYFKNYIDIRKRYNICGEYIYYPAQFWSHKNHIYILQGLKILKEKYAKKINAVFSGSDQGNLNYVLQKVKEYQLVDQIYYIGFVDKEEIPYLYKQSLALAMPTYFGPTNIPPLEAFKLGCPVLYSDLPGLRDQVKDAAYLLDLNDPDNLAKTILEILDRESPNIKKLIMNGKKKVEEWTEQHYWQKLKKVFDEYDIKLQCWK